MKLKGIGASNGISFAKVFELKETPIEISNYKITDVEKEILKVNKAIEKVISQIQKIKEVAQKNLGEKEAQVFDAHIQVASDPAMFEEIKNMVVGEKTNAIYATSMVTNNFAAIFETMEDEYMKERASDIKDVAKKLMYALAGVELPLITSINEEVIIVAEDLTPSDTAQLDKKFVKGFITDIGGRTSHAAIMARSLEIPAVLGLKNATSVVKSGDYLAIDGNSGDVLINPSSEELDLFKKKAKDEEKIKLENKSFIGKKTLTKDGFEVELAANIGSPKDTKGANENDAQAIGLFRSEFLYMDASSWPTEDEQYDSYSQVLKSMGNKLVVVRTLDIGGDKTLKYFTFPHEMNPFLGYRAIRLCLDKKDVFKTQLRALLRSSVYGKLAIMFPMIATIEEFLEAKSEFEEAKKELKEEKIAFSEDIQIGMMVEIPSTAVLAKQFAKHADFFSIGTNDLMQYTFAADRMSEKVSYLYQPLNPSILQMINMTIEGAHSENKWVGMCGEMASDSNVVPILIGMGLNEFSMSASSILSTRRLISKISLKEAKELAKNALNSATEKEVKLLVEKFNLNSK